MSEQKQPSVGRIVHYHVGAFDGPEMRHNHTEEEDLPAVIVRVWSDTCVNLKVFTDGPTDVWKTSVLLGDKPGEWGWPIYVPPVTKPETP